MVDAALLCVLIVTAVVILVCAVVKERLWAIRRNALVDIKKNVYEMALSGAPASPAVCLPTAVSSITPQQFIDIETNRRVDAAFFNDSEKQFFRTCFIGPAQISALKKTAKNSKNKWRRIEAMLSLGYMQAKEAIDVLKSSLLDKDKDIAYFAIVALGQIKIVESARILLSFMKRDPSNCYKIVSVLDGFPEEIAGDIIGLTEYHDPMIRFWAATLLSKLHPSGYVKKLERLTQDASAEVRAAACDCLGNIGKEESKQKVISCFKDDSWLVRKHAISALEKIMKDRAVPEVINLINDASWSVVESVKEVMTAHIEASLPYIERFLSGNNEVAMKYSVYALQDSGYIIKLLKNAVSGPDKDRALRILKGIVRSHNHFGLDAALNRLDHDTRAKALEIITHIEEK